MRRLLNLSALMPISAPLFAQEAVTEPAPVPAQNSEALFTPMNVLILVFILTGLILLWVSFTLLNTFKMMAKEYVNPTPYVKTETKLLEYEEWKAQEKAKPGIWTKLLSLKPISEEKDMMLNHEFDGISELDNPTPPWFNWLFMISIVFAVGYFLSYEVFGWGPTQEQEYVVEMQQAKIAKDKFLASSANNIDENSVKESTDAGVISAGKAIFDANCIACHGDKGQGTVGPNLTDKYWLHGGKVNNIFKTIKYGVPEKGMIAWEKTLTPKQISEVSNYILSLKGTNPPNAKAPQGDEEG